MEVKNVKFGIKGIATGVDAHKTGELAEKAEKLGYDYIAHTNHIGKSLYPLATLPYMAAKTTTFMLGALYPVPRYIPSQLATWLANLDYLSNGRVIAIFGAGHGFDEFINYSPSQGVYPEASVRVSQYIEGLKLIKKMWTSRGEVQFKGKYYTLKDAVLYPQPIQKPHPAIWQPGGKPLMLKIAAKYCDGWVGPIWGPLAITPEEFELNVKTIQRHGQKYNRDMSKFAFVCQGTQSGGDTAEMVEKYRAAGAQYYHIGGPDNFNEHANWLRKFAEEVIPSFK